MCYLLIGKNLKDENAFCFLNDLKKKFLSSFDPDRIYTAFAYELKSFNHEIKCLFDYYENNPKTINDQLRENLIESAQILKESYDDLLERNQKISVISQKSNSLLTSSFETKNIVIDLILIDF